jgi:hypothetical protein
VTERPFFNWLSCFHLICTVVSTIILSHGVVVEADAVVAATESLATTFHPLTLLIHSVSTARAHHGSNRKRAAFRECVSIASVCEREKYNGDIKRPK